MHVSCRSGNIRCRTIREVKQPRPPKSTVLGDLALLHPPPATSRGHIQRKESQRQELQCQAARSISRCFPDTQCVRRVRLRQISLNGSRSLPQADFSFATSFCKCFLLTAGVGTSATELNAKSFRSPVTDFVSRPVGDHV